MRTNSERLAAMHKRAGEIENEKRRGRVRLASFASCVAGLLLIIAFSLRMPETSGTLAPGGAGSMSASIFSDSGCLGFIVIGIVAFLLGSAVTVFCFRMKEWRRNMEKKDDANDRND